jgi:hypothetical protein
VAQGRGDLGGGLAAVPGDVQPAVPERSGALGEVDVVAAGVAPAAFRWVGGGSIQFDAQPVVLVQVVQVAGAAAVPTPRLAFRDREAMGALDPVDVDAFQRGVDALGGVLQGAGDPVAPAHPRASGEGLAEQFGCGEAASDRGRDPSVGVVQGPRRGDQVQDRGRHRGPWQLPRRLPFRNQIPRSVDDHSPDGLVPTWALYHCNTYVDLPAGLVCQAVDLSRSLVAEHGTRPDAEHRGPQFRLPGQHSVEGRVDPVMQAPPRTRVKLPVDGLAGETRVVCLLPRDDTGLGLELATPDETAFVFHAHQPERAL